MNTIIIILSFLPLALVGMVIYFNQRINKVIKDVDVNVKMPLLNLTKTVEEKTKAFREYIVEVSNHTDILSNTIARHKEAHEEVYFRLASKGELGDVIARYDSIWRRIDGKINILFNKIYPTNNEPLPEDAPEQLLNKKWKEWQEYSKSWDKAFEEAVKKAGQADSSSTKTPEETMESLNKTLDELMPVTTPPKKRGRKPLPKKQVGVRKKVSSRRGKG